MAVVDVAGKRGPIYRKGYSDKPICDDTQIEYQ
ncbi:hypothetical protein CHEID_03480 [Corynebacterium heidelbergense]|nr:hypothetical protein CHEID_03480 [Corynebacterium heidelbergense]